MKDISINVKNLTKNYKLYDKPIHRLIDLFPFIKNKYRHDFTAIDDVTFDVKKGEIVGLIGGNGAGKSTILKTLTGVSSYKGTIETYGTIASLLELGTGFDHELSGYENIYYQGYLMGLKKDEIDDRLDDIINFADIGDFLYEPVKKYSSGMFARLAFSTAINVNPDILIVDEVLSVGDIKFTMKCMRKIEELSESGVTILLVSHNSDQIAQYCNRVIWIKDHKIFKEGSPREIVPMYNDYMIFGEIDDDKNKIEEKEQTIHIESVEKENNNFQIKSIEFTNPNGLNIDNETKEINIMFNIELLNKEIQFKPDIDCYVSVMIANDNNYPLLHRGYTCRINEQEINDNMFKFEVTIKEPNFKNGNYPISIDLGDLSSGNFELQQKLNTVAILNVSKTGEEYTGWGSFAISD